jgi:hypothetical protein
VRSPQHQQSVARSGGSRKSARAAVTVMREPLHRGGPR